MSSRYIALESRVLEQFLSENGFSRIVQGQEIVYTRDVVLSLEGKKFRHDPGVKVKVYTSISAGQGTIRPAGEDAIRVVCAYEGLKPITPWGWEKPPSKSFGIFKAKRIFRTGSQEKILERMLERMREAYQAGIEFLKERAREFNAVAIP